MSVRLLAALLLGASLAGSCSAQGPDEVVLVSREWADLEWTCWNGFDFMCRIEFPGQTFRDADGRVATVGPTDMVWRLEVSGSEAECGGDMIRDQTSFFRFAPSGPDETPRQSLVFDDGSAVQLFVKSTTVVWDKCSESVGRWEGVAGTFEGRTGTYRWTDDGLQIELVLTDS